jgi:HAD superfamily hydrolase (TIGR01509 family)
MRTGDIRAVVFDLDGVLADSEGLHILAWEEIAREYRLSGDHMPLHDWIGYPDTEIVQEVVRDYALSISPGELLEHKRRIYRRLVAERLTPIPGSLEALDQLDSIPLGLATSSSRSEVELMLRVLGIADRFRTIVTSDDVACSKPAPDTYRLAVKRLGVAPENCVAVEDSSTGMQSALRAGLTVLAVTNSLPEDKLQAAHRIFASTEQAVRWIKARLRSVETAS